MDRGGLLAVMDDVMRRNGAADAASFNDDPTYKGRLNEVCVCGGSSECD